MKKPFPQRIASLDALRGFDMFWIIGGGGLIHGLHELFGGNVLLVLSDQLHHVPWHGFHFQDLIFPLFVYVVGSAIPFSLSKSLSVEPLNKLLYLRILRRTLLLFALGLLYNGAPLADFFSDIRIMGVLQRISICYLASSLAFLKLRRRNQGILCFSLLALYWVLMKYVPVPGHGPGVLTPEGNLAAHVDSLVLPGRMHAGSWDPEGLLSTLPAISTCLLGVLTGHWIRSSKAPTVRWGGLVVAGAAGVFAGSLLNGAFPVNKALWSPSFVLLTAGCSALLLSFFYGVMDVLGYKKWAFFFLVIGMNPITIYMVHHLLSLGSGLDHVAGETLFSFLRDGRRLAVELLDMAVKWLFLYVLYRKKLFLRV